MDGFFIYGILVPRVWHVTKEMESGIDFNDMIGEFNMILSPDDNLIYYFITTRNGDEMLLGKSLSVPDENKTSRTIIVPEIDRNDKRLISWECDLEYCFKLKPNEFEFNLYYVKSFS